MTARNLLEQLLQSGLGRGVPRDDLGKYATGAVAGGALALLLGTKRGRGVGGKLLKYGSVAALGAVAWRAYQDWQAKQAPQSTPPAAMPAAPAFERLPAPQLEAHSQAMLKAMIAAAKADGHLDERERGLVEAELHRLDADPTMHAWVDAELRRPVEPADVAAGAASPEMAAEIYLASLVVADDRSTMERAYLDALATELKLPPALKDDLERRAAQG